MWVDYELTDEQINEVENWLNKEGAAMISIFTPGEYGPHGCSDEEYFNWLYSLYPEKVFKPTNSMGSDSLQSHINSYLQTWWVHRNDSPVAILYELGRLRKEVIPLRKLKEKVNNWREANVELMNRWGE